MCGSKNELARVKERMLLSFLTWLMLDFLRLSPACPIQVLASRPTLWTCSLVRPANGCDVERGLFLSTGVCRGCVNGAFPVLHWSMPACVQGLWERKSYIQAIIISTLPLESNLSHRRQSSGNYNCRRWVFYGITGL